MIAWVGALACASPAVSAPTEPAPFLRAPFTGEHRAAEIFDHQYPIAGGQDGSQLATWGRASWGEDGHAGYDWVMPAGTEILASAAGTVIAAGRVPPFPCPRLGRVTGDQLEVRILHERPEGRWTTAYHHLSAVSVSVGDVVDAGVVLGPSGNTGCSTGEHLHFEVAHADPNGRWVPVDPYGWAGPGADPWAAHADGAPSPNLWVQGAAPPLFRERRLRARAVGSDLEVGITELRVVGFSAPGGAGTSQSTLASIGRACDGRISVTARRW